MATPTARCRSAWASGPILSQKNTHGVPLRHSHSNLLLPVLLGQQKMGSTSWLALRGVLGTLMVKLLFLALYFLLSHTDIMFHIVLPRIENSTTQWSQCSTVMNSLARAAAAVESLSPLSSIWWGMCTEHKEHLFGAFLQCNLKANVKCPNRRSMVSDNQIISK